MIFPDRKTNRCGKDCWLICRTHDVKNELPYRVLNLIIENQYVDGFKVNSCKSIFLDASIIFLGKDSQEEVVKYTINYMTYVGNCYERQYTLKTSDIPPSASQTVVLKSESKGVECLPSLLRKGICFS